MKSQEKDENIKKKSALQECSAQLSIILDMAQKFARTTRLHRNKNLAIFGLLIQEVHSLAIIAHFEPKLHKLHIL